LDMGFREDIEAILKHVPQQRQTSLFSATMSPEILQITKTYQQNPRIVRINTEDRSKPNIEQVYFDVGPRMKVDLLARLIDLHTPKRSIVFCNTRRKVDEVQRELRPLGYSVEGIHGEVSQARRTKVMDRFRTGQTNILIATDVAARGIDVSDVEVVFNYEIPQQAEAYVHRIGRTGRAGKAGKAFNFVSQRDMYRFRDVQRFLKETIAEEQVPCEKTLKSAQEDKVLQSIKQVVDSEELAKYVDMVIKLTDEGVNSIDIAAALLKMSGLVKERKVAIRPAQSSFSPRGQQSESDGSRFSRKRFRGGNGQRRNGFRKSYGERAN
ncbi:MAG: DEAD/DEAH box helicase, partial [bacterium]